MAMPPALARANAINALKNAGFTEAVATSMVDGGRRAAGSGRAHGETVVPSAGGDGIRPAGATGSLYAAVEASPVLQYDQRAIAAIWQGLIDGLRFGDAVDGAALFDECNLNIPQREFAQERAMGLQMSKLEPVALKQLGVTVAEWSAWYARSAAITLRPHAAGCGCGCGTNAGHGAPASTEPPKAAVSNWNSPFGQPLLTGRQ